MRRYSALMVGESNGLLHSEGDQFPGSPDYYERVVMVRYDDAQAEIERLKKELRAANKGAERNANINLMLTRKVAAMREWCDQNGVPVKEVWHQEAIKEWNNRREEVEK